MQPVSAVCWRFDLFGWPCLSQSEWASWIQVVAALVGIALALYIPVRMKRLDDLERMRSAVSRLERLREVSARLVAVLDDVKAPVPAKAEIETSKAACEAMIQDSATDASYIPALGRSNEAARVLHVVWQYLAAGGPHREQHGKSARDAAAQIDASFQEAQAIIARWKKKHWFAMLMHG